MQVLLAKCSRGYPPFNIIHREETILDRAVICEGTYDAKADMHCLYSSANGNGRAALRMYHEQFPDRRMPDHILRPLHRQQGSFHVTRYDAGLRTTVYILNI
ncbi:hypothetical protein CDAR_365711 [Caerostris darwini]|uniref:DUF4817 domain-containing protein n=1 Tax=Caerostris darwini TaxID=1538125 RepID=A0AAV4RE94_9ARAC|nr:hypothetical protein CDAR_365711 [Caerostris darwini]